MHSPPPRVVAPDGAREVEAILKQKPLSQMEEGMHSAGVEILSSCPIRTKKRMEMGRGFPLVENALTEPERPS